MSEGKLLRNEATKYWTDIYNLIKQNLVAYSGFVSLVNELIQNSDDSSRGKEVEIIIDFRDDMLVLKNNTFFSDNDWSKIEEIASGNKERDPYSTGRFGIGFTSVFKICDNLNIHSKGVSKRFELGTLDWIPYEGFRYQDLDITEFEFFWRKNPTDSGNKIGSPALNEDDLFEFRKETIDSIYKNVHFLNNVTKIAILENGKLIQKIDIKKERPKNVSNLLDGVKKEERVITVTNSNNYEEIFTFLMYTQNIDRDFTQEYNSNIARKKPLMLSIAVNKESLKEGRIFCTLPTSECLDWLFDINCDFWPGTSRKHIIIEKDDPRGKYNLKILSYIPEMLLSITEDLKNNLSKTSFYSLLNSFLIRDKALFKEYSRNYIHLLKDSRPNIIFLQEKWLPVSKVKYTKEKEKYLIPFLCKINYSVIPQEDLKFSYLFSELGMKEFTLNDLINELKTIPDGIELDKSIIRTKEELKNILNYLDNKQADSKRCRSEINCLNIFLTNKGKLVNEEICKFYIFPDELSSFKSDFDLPEIDNDILEEFDLLLSNTLGIFRKLSDTDLASKILKDFENKDFPIKVEESVAYLNTKEKILNVIDFLDLYIRNSISFKNEGSIIHKKQIYYPGTSQYDSIKKFYVHLEKLPLILSSNNLLYPWKNNKVFNLNSSLQKEFAARYKIESIDPGVLDKIKRYTTYNHLKLKNIIEYVEISVKDGELFDPDFIQLLYKLILKDSNQLSENNLKNRIKNLPIFLDIYGSSCCLENNGKKTFLKGTYSDRFGIVKILDVKLINSVPSFKEDILKNRFGINDLTFELYIIDYFHIIFENDSIEKDRKLHLIKDLNEYYPTIEKSVYLDEIKLALKKTKLIYCKNKRFYYPEDQFIYKYTTIAEKEFASMHDLEIMELEVEKMDFKYNLVKQINLKDILEYVMIDIGKNNFARNEYYLKNLYTLIFEKKYELNNENLRTIRKLKIFRDSSGNLTTLENILLQGDYQIPTDIHINEILDESIISKVVGFKEKILVEIFDLKYLDYKTFINRHFKSIYDNPKIRTDVKLNLFHELYTRFATLEEDNIFNSIKNTLVDSNIVYCQDGNFHYPTSRNLFIKSELMDEIFGEEYLYPNFDMDKYKHIFKELGIKDSLEPRQIVDFIRESVLNVEVSDQLLNKMKKMFVSINKHFEDFGSDAKEFQHLSGLEWLPASNLSNKLYKPSELYTQSGHNNTRPYLEHLDYVKYLDIKDADLREKDSRRDIKVEFIKVLNLNNIEKIPISMLIDNIEAASKDNRPLTTKMNFLNIYELLNSKINHYEISRLNNFPSFQIIYKDDGKPLYFKPSEIFKRDFQSLFGTEYFGYLSLNYISKCESLLNRLGILEEPNKDSIINLLQMIYRKYEADNLNILSENDRNIVLNCLAYLDKNLSDINDSFVIELKKLPIFLNKNNHLLSADLCIIEDDPVLCQEFGHVLSDHLIKLDDKYSGLVQRLEIAGLHQLLKKQMLILPDPLKIYINSNFTQRVQSFAKLMTRVKIGNRELNSNKWLKINSGIEVYTYDNLSVSRYIEWDNKKYYSNIDNVHCYLEIKNGILDRIYIKGNNEEIRNSLAYELYEEIHPNINQSFMAIIDILLCATTYEEMDTKLTYFRYPVIENSDSTVKSDRITIDTFEDSPSQNVSLIELERTPEKVIVCSTERNVEKIDLLVTFDPKSEDANEKDIKSCLIEGEETTEDMVTADNDIERKLNAITPTISKPSIDMSVPELSLQNFFGKDQKSNIDHNVSNSNHKKTNNQNKDKNDTISVTRHLKSYIDDGENDFDYHDSDDDEEIVTVGRTTSPTKQTNYKKKLSEKYSRQHSNSIDTNMNFEINLASALRDDIPRSIEDKENIMKKTQEEITRDVDQLNLDNSNREYSSRLDPNKDDEIADAEVRIWYDGKCQICGKTFKKEGSGDNYSEVIKLLDIREQGITHTANKLCLCSYHASILKKGQISIDFDKLVNNKLDITIHNEYENGYRDSDCHINYNEIHFLQLKALLEINNSY